MLLAFILGQCLAVIRLVTCVLAVLVEAGITFSGICVSVHAKSINV